MNGLQLLDLKVDEKIVMVRDNTNGELDSTPNSSVKNKNSHQSMEKGSNNKHKIDLKSVKVDPIQKLNVIDSSCQMMAHGTWSVRYYFAIEQAIKKKATCKKGIGTTSKVVSKKKKKKKDSLELQLGIEENEKATCVKGKKLR